jgi:YVTN family beta-propeller protein
MERNSVVVSLASMARRARSANFAVRAFLGETLRRMRHALRTAVFQGLAPFVLLLAILLTPPVQAQPFAYVANFQNNNLSVIDLNFFFTVTTVPLGTNPFGVAVNPAGTYVYVTNLGGNAVSVVRTSDNIKITDIPVGNAPAGIAVTPDGARVYVANSGIGNTGTTVSVINTTTDTVVDTVTVGAGPTGLAVHPSGSSVYVTNWTSGTVSVINTASNPNVVTATINVGTQPYGVAFNAAGTRAYVTNYGSNSVSVIDTASNSVLTTISVDVQPTGVVVHPNGTRVYVANSGGSSVSVIDATNSVLLTGITALGMSNPRGLSLTNAGNVLLVTSPTNGQLDFFDTATNASVGNNGLSPGIFSVGNFVGPNASLVAPTITSAAPTTASVDVPFSYYPIATGSAPVLWRVTGGSLPPGLTLGARGGAILGTPSTTGVYNFNLVADNGVNPPATQVISLTVNPSPYCQFNGASGSWTDPLKWTGNCNGLSPAGTPASTDLVRIANASVTLPTGTLSVASLNLIGNVTLTGTGYASTSLDITGGTSDWTSASTLNFNSMTLFTALGAEVYTADLDINLNDAYLRNAGLLSFDGSLVTMTGGGKVINQGGGTIENFGGITLQFSGPVQNEGMINAVDTVLTDASLFTQTAPLARLRVRNVLAGLSGALTLDEGSVETFDNQPATLNFVEVINLGASLKPRRNNDGLTEPETMTILGNYTQGPAGQLLLAWCDVFDYDKLNVLGNVTLNGEIGVMLGSNCVGATPVPSPGDVIDAVLFANNGRTGTFATLTPPSGYNLTADYSATDRVQLIFVGSPELTLSPTDFNFGNRLIGSTSSPLTGTISNTGGSSITFRGSPPNVPTTPFAIDLTNCLGNTLAPNQGCGYSVTFSPTALTSSTVDLLPHISAAVQTPAVTISNSTLMASGTGVAPAAPNVALSLSPPTRNVSVPTTLIVTLTNTNPSAMNGADFVLTYPAGLINAVAPNAASTCGTPIVAAVTGGNTLTFSSGTVPPTGNCNVTVNVVANTAGVYNVNLPIGSITTVSFGSNTAAASAVFVVSTPGSAPWQADSVIAGGGTHSLAIRTNGEVWSWGTDNGNALGRSNNTENSPSPITTLGNSVRSVAGGAWYGVALKTDGSVWAWGTSDRVGPAVGQSLSGTVPLPAQVLGISSAVGISTRYFHTLVLISDGTVWGFGPETSSALGPTVGNLAARQIPGVSNARQVAAGEQHSLALLSDGTVQSWGANTQGQLGVAGGSQSAPQTVPISDVIAITATSFASFALKSDGTVWGWGAGNSTPMPIAGGTGVASIAAGNNVALALKTDGTVLGWGDNTFGRVGIGTFGGTVSSFTLLGGLSNIAHIAGGEFHSLAAPAGGTVFAWGNNGNKQRCGTTGADVNVPTACAFSLAPGVAPLITSVAPPSGTVNVPYSHTAAATGTPTPTWSVTGGSLPPGLTLNATSGVISGTPTTAGTYLFTLVASNAVAPDATQAVTLVIASPSAPVVSLSSSTVSFSPEVVGATSASQTVTVSNTGNADLTFAGIVLGGAVPGDFAKSGTCSTSVPVAASGSCTVVLTFTPSAVGTRTATVTLTNNATGSPHIISLSGDGVAAPVACTAGSYSATGQTPCTAASPGYFVSGTGATTQTACSIGTFSSSSGASSCTPASPGSFVSITGATTQTACAAGTFSAAAGSNSCTPAAPGSFVATAGSSAAIPCAPGSYQPASGQTSCTLASANFYVATAGATSQIACSMGQTSPPGATACTSGTPPTITSGVPPSGLVGTAYAFTFTATGTTPITWAIGSGTLPPGLVLNSSTGALTGTPTTAGTFAFSVTATNTASPVSLSTAITIAVPIVPAINVSPSNLDFGNQVVETTSSPQSVTVSNTGNGPFDITGISFVGDFAYSSDCPRTLQPNAACTLNVTFSPLIAGVRNGRISVNNTASAGNSGINLSGTGVLAPRANMIVTPAGGLSFSSQAAGTSSLPQAIYISNTGQLDLQIALSVNGAPQFSRVAAPSADNPNNLPECGGSVTSFTGVVRAGTSCILGVRFSPLVTGTVLGGLSITHNGSATGATVQTNVPFTGTGTARLEALIRVSGGLNFADTVVGRPGTTQTVTVSNTGTIDLTVSGTSVVSGNASTTSSDFTLTNGCTQPVVPNGSCTIGVTFTPTGATGAKSATLVVQSNASNAPTTATGAIGINAVSLFGSALAVPQPLVQLSATSVGFGSTVVPKVIGPRTVTLTNAGNEVLTLQGLVLTSSGGASEAPAFTRAETVANACRVNQSLLPNQSCVLSLSYTATAVGARTGTLTITSNAPSSPDRVQLSGSGCIVGGVFISRFFVPTASCGQ